MDSNVVTTICGVAIVVGIIGTVIPYVPGLILSWLGVLVWALLTEGGSGRWIAVGVATVLALLGTVMKFVLPGRKLKREGVPAASLISGGLLAIVGFFVVPVIGLFLGFVLGVFIAEWIRHGSVGQAWPSTWRAVKAVGFSMVIEILFGLLILSVWIWAVVTV